MPLTKEIRDAMPPKEKKEKVEAPVKKEAKHKTKAKAKEEAAAAKVTKKSVKGKCWHVFECSLP